MPDPYSLATTNKKLQPIQSNLFISFKLNSTCHNNSNVNWRSPEGKEAFTSFLLDEVKFFR
jgi:hypothetical protein